jgi:hypothetical protein
MRLEKTSAGLAGIMLALALTSAAMGCSSSGMASGKDAAISGGSGGTTSSIAAGFGGTSTPGGASGSGGVTATGGQPSTGGETSSASGGSTGSRGGATGVGGTIPLGGTTGVGGAIGVGGTIPLGGATGIGGTIGQGGGPGTGGTAGGQGGSTGPSTAAGGSTAGGQGGSTGTCAPSTVATSPVITFNDDGAWFAYQDERAVVDVKAGKLVVGSVASGRSRSGNIEAVVYDLATGKASAPAKLGNLPVDEYNAPAFVVRPDGKYVAVWAGHRIDCNTHYSIYDGSAWSAQMTFDWTSVGCPWNGDSTQMITYSNVWYMGGQLFDFVRSAGTSPNALASTDDGASWSYYGRLTSMATAGYVAGYYKYWGNNRDRIDFLATEAHPRDNDNNLWHGYLQGGRIHNSTGTVVDDAFAGTSDPSSAQDITKYTKVFATGSTVGKVKLDHAWNYDIVRYDDGTIAILGQGRVAGSGTDDPDKRSFYGRFDGSTWTLTYLAKMGSKLSSSEEDYTGMGALHPDDPTSIFISTPYDPRDDATKSSKHEIWRGTTCDNGATFQWTPVTAKSTMSSIRPIVPKWDAQHTALLWLQGTFTTVSDITSSVVGTISGPGTGMGAVGRASRPFRSLH